MKIRNRIKELRLVKASELSPNPRNWRTHPQGQQDALKGILAEVGYADALLARELPDGGLEIVDGHLRAETTPEEEVPVLVLDIDEDEAKKLLTVLDPLAAMAETNKDALGRLLADVQTESDGLDAMLKDLAKGNGIDLFETAGAADAPEAQMDRAAELQKEWGTELGQLWEIPGKAGTHRLLCGDSTDGERVGCFFDGAIAYLMATDPPYGVDFSGKKYNPRAKQWSGIANDKRQGADLTQWLGSVLNAWMPSMAPEACFYLWTAPMQEGFAAAAAAAAGVHIQGQIIWAKNQFALGQADYQWKHEPCWYGYRKGKKHRWLSDRKQDTVWEVDKVPNAKYEHPHQKPVELYARPIRHHLHDGEIVADPFLGSGTTMVAAEQLGRICYGIEIAPQYVAVALQRMKDMGLEPRLAEAA